MTYGVHADAPYLQFRTVRCGPTFRHVFINDPQPIGRRLTVHLGTGDREIKANPDAMIV